MGTTDEKSATANFAFSKTHNSGNSSTEPCANCGRTNHSTYQCRKGKNKFGDKKHAKGGSSKRGGMNGNHRSDSRKCYVCGNEGHIARDCDERCDKGDSKKGGKNIKHSGDGGNGGKPKWYGSSESFKNRRKSDDDDDATGLDQCSLKLKKSKKRKHLFPCKHSTMTML
jgi:hypothetical protein